MSTPTKAAVLKLAGEAEVDPRTAAKFLRGDPMRRGLQLDRLQRAARVLGAEVPQPRDGTTPQPEAK